MTTRLGLETEVIDADVRQRAVEHFRANEIRLPKFGELADPTTIPASIQESLADVDPDAADPRNLFRVHWYNDPSRRGLAPVPSHAVLPSSVTGVPAKIIVAFGDRFPMIEAHKVLAAYACLAPRVVTGQFDPISHRALWPSTGNYCRGGVAISRSMGCHGVAILPEGMSQERFDWLDRWIVDDADIVRTPGTESNVKEIYDKCNELDREPENVIFNQFCEFGNHLAHFLVTGRALEHVFTHVRDAGDGGLNLRAFVSASGSAGTLGAGDHLKDRFDAQVVAVEALECPTMLENGFGAHNIQGIGDKHIPLIHNVMGTDFAVGVSDRATDRLGVLFGSEIGAAYLRDRRGVSEQTLTDVGRLGLSGICNVLAAIKTARYLGLGEDDAIITIATDSAAMYRSEREQARASFFPNGFDAVAAGETFGEHVLGLGVDHLMELSLVERRRIFNLGYFTWVEQQGISVEEFSARREASFWRGLRSRLPAWDEQIEAFNREVGLPDAPS